MLCRPVGIGLFHHHRNTLDVSLGGMRVYTDESFSTGSKLQLDVLLPDGEPVRVWAQVVWHLTLDGAAPARYDVGLKFLDMAPADIQRLASVLVRG